MIVNTTMKEIAAIRLYKARLFNNYDNIYDTVYNNIGIQAQYNTFAMLSIFNRTARCSLGKIEKAGQNHELVNAWGQRVTLHIYVNEDWKLINQVYKDRKNWVKNHITNSNREHKNVIQAIDEEACKHDLFTKTDISIALDLTINKELMSWGGVLIEASLHNKIVGKVSSKGEKKYLHYSKMKIKNECSANNPIKELIIRYIKNYGPVSIKDIMHWSGMNRYEIISSFEEIKNALIELQVLDEVYYMFRDEYELYKRDKVNYSRKLIMLGKFDPLMVSYKNKEWITNEKYIKTIWQKGGQIEAVIISNNRAIGTWRYKMTKVKMDFDVFLFKSISEQKKVRIEKNAERIAQFYKKDLGKVNFN